jgi:hypothetical protein
MRLLFSLFALSLCLFAQAQSSNTLPNLPCGQQTRDWIKQNHFDTKIRISTISYNSARQYMYAYVDNPSTKVTCVYGGHEHNYTPNPAPTSPVQTTPPSSWFTSLSTGGTLIINCEHTIPQSFFSENLPMRGDIHHLFPTYEQWNNDRNNFRFTDIPDNLTTKWERLLTSQTTIPTSLIHEYSEFGIVNGEQVYEPREDHKGKLARAVLYFYTVYPTQAGAITRVAELATLQKWHEQFPVTAEERARNNRIEQVQGNRNPFVDNPTWVYQAYCLTPNATSVFDKNTEGGQNLKIQSLRQASAFSHLSVELVAQKSGVGTAQIFDTMGKLISTHTLSIGVGVQTLNLPTENLTTGLYILKLTQGQDSVSEKFIRL